VMRNDFQQSVIELILQPGIIIWDKSSQMVTDDINKKKKKILFKDFKWSKSCDWIDKNQTFILKRPPNQD
jgi:hypothetical protein